MTEFTEAEKAWLACAIDCEGYVALRTDRRHNTVNPVIYLSNTNLEFIQRFNRLAHGGIYSRNPRGFGKKMQHEVYVTSKERVGRILDAILPYFVIKQEKAAEVLQWIRDHPLSRRENMAQLNRILPRAPGGFNRILSA